MAIEYRDSVAGKVCNRCNDWKPVSGFSRQSANLKRGGDGYLYTCRTCHAAERRAQRASNLEYARAKQRGYYSRNREKVQASVQAYRKLYPERVQLSQKLYYERNRALRQEKQRTRNTRARMEHGEKLRAYFRSYYSRRKQENYLAVRLHEAKNERRRRARKAHASGSHTESEWQLLKTHYNNTCLRCGRCEPDIILTRDHVIPLARGGSDNIDNIQPLCGHCNSAKNANSIDYRPLWKPDLSSTESAGR